MNFRTFLTITVLLIVIGFSVMFMGLIYDVLFAGIPYQDPTPELLAEYNRNKATATRLFYIGGFFSSAGSIAAVVMAIWSVRRMLKEPAQPQDSASNQG